LSGIMKDWLSHLASTGVLGPALTGPGVPYSTVYVLEIVMLFVTLVALGPLVDKRRTVEAGRLRVFGLADTPA
jgi:BCD family chlorophyll transporter-like MFS transporter